jgi:hypothetical protein
MAGLDSQLIALPSARLTAARAAVLAGRSLREGNIGKADIMVLQLGDDLATAEPALRAALVISPPPTTGDRRYDGWIAGLTEYRLAQVGIPAPAWVHEPSRAADEDWAVGDIPGLTEVIRAETPEPFSRRRILISAADLVSV